MTLEDEFICPFHEAPLKTPCRLEQCDLYLAHHPLHCGFVAFRAVTSQSGSDELSWDRIATLTGYSGASEVEHLAKQGYEMLRHLAVAEKSPAEWSLLPNSRSCIVCNRRATLCEAGWSYCSDDCRQWLPPAAASIEAKWGCWFKTLLSEWKQLNARTIERLTGLNREAVRRLLWQHLGWSGADSGNELEETPEPLLPNPKIPTVREILRRLEAADRWSAQ